MPDPLSVAIYSGSSTALLWLLFRIESKRGNRFMGAFRSWLDELVLRAGAGLERVGRFLGRDIIRQSVHYIFHLVLTACLGAIRTVELQIQKVVHFNRTRARESVRDASQKTIFDEIQEHKRDTALTAAQRRKHKAKALEGK